MVSIICICFPLFPEGEEWSDGVKIKVTGAFSYKLSWSGGLGQRESPVRVPSAWEGTPFPTARDSCCLEAVALTPLWLRAGTGLCFLPFLPESHHPWKGKHGKAPKGKELHCRVDSDMLDAVWWHCHIHMQLMGTCCTVYEDKEFICKHDVCDEWQYHIANIF